MDSHHIDNTPLLLSREDEAALLTEQARHIFARCRRRMVLVAMTET